MNDTRIQIFTTGGTIDKSYFDELSKYQVGESKVADFLRSAKVSLPFEVSEIFRKDSLDLCDQDRELIRHRVANSEVDRLIITHGTDTMTETANALADVPGKTIVLVGALTPARFAESDAVFNLGMAFATAQIAPCGVYITMNGTVFRANHVRKDRELGAFVNI